MSISVTPGSGAAVATDVVAGEHWQTFKLGIGGAGTATFLTFGQALKAASLPVTIASDDTVKVNQVTSAYDPKVTITRPANTTAYDVRDVVGGVQTFSSIGPSAATIVITGAELEIDIDAIPSGMTSFRLHLYSAAPGTNLADNVAFDLPSGDRASYLGFLDLGAPEDLGSTLYVATDGLNKQLKLANANLYAYLVTSSAFTPGNGDVLRVTLHAQAV